MLKIPKVFISYGKEDKETVKKLYNFLHSNGFNVWLDENELLPGDYWENVINNSIKETDYFLMCLSSKTVSKFGYFNKEIKKAFEIQRYYPINTAFIMPLRLDKFEIPDWLKHIHCADIFPESLSKFEKLANDIKQQHKKRMLSNR